MNEIFYSTTLKSNIKQISKVTARHAYNLGLTVYLVPCKMSFDCPYIAPGFSVNKNELKNEDFQKICNYFAYYNCNQETGKYIHFYIKSR